VWLGPFQGPLQFTQVAVLQSGHLKRELAPILQVFESRSREDPCVRMQPGLLQYVLSSIWVLYSGRRPAYLVRRSSRCPAWTFG
jgi:hypothetical protein